VVVIVVEIVGSLVVVVVILAVVLVVRVVEVVVVSVVVVVAIEVVVVVVDVIELCVLFLCWFVISIGGMSFDVAGKNKRLPDLACASLSFCSGLGRILRVLSPGGLSIWLSGHLYFFQLVGVDLVRLFEVGVEIDEVAVEEVGKEVGVSVEGLSVLFMTVSKVGLLLAARHVAG
jgi:hypothetical protein